MIYGSGITFDDLLFSTSATGDSFSPKESNKHCLQSHKRPHKLDNRKKIHTIRECEIELLLKIHTYIHACAHRPLVYCFSTNIMEKCITVYSNIILLSYLHEMVETQQRWRLSNLDNKSSLTLSNSMYWPSWWWDYVYTANHPEHKRVEYRMHNSASYIPEDSHF